MIDKIPLIGGSSDEPDEVNEDTLDEIADLHVDVISPIGIYKSGSFAKIGDKYVKTIFVKGWPDVGEPMYLRGLFSSNADVDISLHIEPQNKQRMLDEIRSRIGGVTNEAATSEEATREIKQSKKELVENLRNVESALTDTKSNMFRVGAYITIRGDSQEEVREARRRLEEAVLTRPPASLQPRVAEDKQIKAATTVSPINKDLIGYKNYMMSGSIANMYPFVNNTLLEDNGVELGEHDYNGNPIMFDRFGRENGYNQFTVGTIGSGKSFSTKLNLLRTRAMRDDIKIIIIDPLKGFVNVTKALGGERIVVGGDNNLNPLEIRYTDPSNIEGELETNPLNTKINSVKDFFEKYFSHRGTKLDKEKDVLEAVIPEVYERAGIRADVLETHKKESPTIRDIMDLLDDIVDDPTVIEDRLPSTDEEVIENYRQGAADLLGKMQEFTSGGQYSNLAKPTEEEMKFEKHDVVYIDLHQFESSDTAKELMMHIMFDKAYEAGKSTNDNVMLTLDEAHYMMEGESLSFLTTAVRHSRHFNMSINFITQTIEEFFDKNTKKAETIVKNCTIKHFHKMETNIRESERQTLGLNDKHVQYIQEAAAGDEGQGFSNALVKIGNASDYMPVKIKPSDQELQIIGDNDEEE